MFNSLRPQGVADRAIKTYHRAAPSVLSSNFIETNTIHILEEVKRTNQEIIKYIKSLNVSPGTE